jgi:hypothetical protein
MPKKGRRERIKRAEKMVACLKVKPAWSYKIYFNFTERKPS